MCLDNRVTYAARADSYEQRGGSVTVSLNISSKPELVVLAELMNE